MLELIECEFSQPTVFTFPKSIARVRATEELHVSLVILTWSFLADSNVRELDFLYVRDVDGRQLGGALAVHLRAKGLGRLRFSTVSFTNETLAAVGVELGRTKILDLGYSDLNDASIELIALALKSPNNEMKELVLPFGGNTVSSIENLLMPALKHPNCNLAELSFRTFEPEHKEAARRVSSTFRKRLALLCCCRGGK
ncbi:hypothetical protein BASA81_015290 [Batrachochytrium salamandrivorans]|nr:hypothetical protein BASA81_015290 [Batrachochytrium salamandrivorans]